MPVVLPPRSERAARLSRRSVVVGALGSGVALAGCSSERDTPEQASPVPGGLAPDVAVATTALAEIRAVRAAVSATRARFPASRTSLAPLVTLHQTHEATLVNAVPDQASTSTSPAPYVVPAQREKALAKLAVREQRLHDTLGGLALRAQSGQFARLLASMGAALQQRLAQWPA